MITQYQFSITGENPLKSADSYKLYSWLQQMMPDDVCDYLHQNTQTPVSQFLFYDQNLGKSVWTISLLGVETERVIAPVLEQVSKIELHTESFDAHCLKQIQIDSVQALVYDAGAMGMDTRTTFRFCTPTSFKQNDRYAIFPQERLILQSLTSKWDVLFPEYPLSDPDAKQILEEGIRISDYRLRSARYPLKGVKIPGFVGEVVIDTHLSAPMQQLWNSLCILAPFTGVGMKTALGMGGVRLIK